MRVLKKAAAGMLCAGMLLSLCSCADEGQSVSSGAGTPAITTAPPVTSTTIDDDIENPVDIKDIDVSPQDFNSVELESPVLQYLGSYHITTAADIKPAWKLYQQTYAGKYYDAAADAYVYPNGQETPIVEQVVGAMQILEVLTTRIQADDSPDLIDKVENTYPFLMSKNTYEDLTPYMDMSAPQWAPLQEYVDRYEYNGKHYFYPWNYDVSPEFLFYNRGLFEEYNIPDPATQWENNEWTWDTFLEACHQFREKSGSERTLGVYGAYLTDNFIASTGSMVISTDESGKFVNNLKDPNVERAALWLESNLRRPGLAMANYYDEYINIDKNPLANGLAAFQAMGGWIFTEYCRDFADSDIFMVPFPRDPEADKYYYRASSFGYLVPKGAKNIQGACCFINCCRLSNTNEELIQTTKESLMRGKKYTEEEYEFLQQFKDIERFDMILDESYCFSTDTTDMLKIMLINIAMDQSDKQQSWAQLVEANSPVFNAELDEFNALIE